MNTEQFKQCLQDFPNEDYQALLDGAALIIEQDKALSLGTSQQAYVIFELGDENFDSVDSLKASLIERSDALIQEYYQHNPLSKMHFNSQLLELIKIHGATAFITMPGQQASVKLFTQDGQLVIETAESVRFKYGFCLVLNDKVLPQAIENKVKNWVSSGSAYDDYISVNVCRFSSTDLDAVESSDYI